MEQQVKLLSDRLKAVGKFYAPRIEPAPLAAAIREGRTVMRWHNDAIEAFAALWPAKGNKNWIEIGPVWVGEKLKGSGVSAELLREAVNLLPLGANSFLITDKGKIREIAKDLSFVPITEEIFEKKFATPRQRTLLGWAADLAEDMVRRMPQSVHAISQGNGERGWGEPKDDERWLFFRVHNAHAE